MIERRYNPVVRALRMRWRGWLRAWAVLMVVAVVTAVILDINALIKQWDTITQSAIKVCVDGESLPGGQPAMECEHQLGADKTAYQHEGITPSAFMLREAGIWTVIDLVLSALLILALTILGWIASGFQKVAPKE